MYNSSCSVYAMMIGSLTDEQARQPRLYRSGKRSVLKTLAPISYRVHPPGTVAPGSNAHIVFSARTICHPNPCHYGISCARSKHRPKLLLCASEVFFFVFFIISPRGAKISDFLFQKMPRPHRKTPRGVSLRLRHHSAPGGVYTRVVTVCTWHECKLPLRNVVDLKSRGCRKLAKGGHHHQASQFTPSTRTPVYCDRMKFDDVCFWF